MIHLLYPAFSDLFFDLLNNFVKSEFILKSDAKTRKSAYHLGKLDLIKNNLDMFKSIHDMNFGTKTKKIIADVEISTNCDKIKTEMKSAYIAIVCYLIKRLPHNSTFIQDAQYFSPTKKITWMLCMLLDALLLKSERY